MANIKVAVRVRPISARELNLTGSQVVVRTDVNEICLTNLKVSSSKAGDSRERTKRYGFDYCFDSSDPEAENFADQTKIYETLGQSALDAVFSGYNSCLVAYGQSASGKTYTMMGTKEDAGLTPRLCEGLISRIEEERKDDKTYRVSVSYLEIYNERVRDLLKPSTSTSGLRVREHPRLGPYVQGLTHHVVRTLGSLMSYVEEGTRARKTASTLQNPSSSRSHALLTITVSPETPSVTVGANSVGSSARRSEAFSRGGSKLRLVDLAGSESAATCSGVHRLKEGANINKSLVALGNVISALAERGSAGSGPGRRFIPYRDSSLTWLLKDALGGNATTIMLATISPASGSYNETAHTLRFAQRAQSVVNRPVVNENPVARIIRELRAEVARLKSLLLEKNVEPDSKALCCCGKNQLTDESNNEIKQSHEELLAKSLVELETRSPETDAEERTEEPRNIAAIRRSNSSESITTYETESIVRRFGSYEFLARNRFTGNYNRARVTELKDEQDEIHESVFVDIPTLVAVLIKPDDSLQERSAQIEEICSDEVVEDSIDAEFIGVSNDREGFDEEKLSVDHDDRSSSVNSCHASGDNELDTYQNSISSTTDATFRTKEKRKIRKQDSMDVLSPILSNLHTSKKFGSVETIQKKKEPLFSFERSHTNLEKRSIVSDRTKKLNNIREIDDQKLCSKNIWRGSKEQLQRKGSNDSDKSLKDSNSQTASKGKNYARKPSLENLKRKTSKDSSSSSSKDEQISISSLTRDKLLRRKNSLEQEPPSTRPHTPIQRVKRAEIVAAVTERLYASKKSTDEASEARSPPEGTEVKSTARMKLQEISRKMLGKRRRVCVDTQTDSSRTIRMKDMASLTETPQVVLQDVGVLTENHEVCETFHDQRVPVLRVKEIATLTDKPKTSIIRCKDVGSLANDLEDLDYEIHSPRNDSGVLSDDTQNYAESNLSSTEVSDLCPEDRRVLYTESSTNTLLFSPCRSFAIQTSGPETFDQRVTDNKSSGCLRQCCTSVQGAQNHLPVDKVEKSVISISLPDTISITIESANILESKIAVTENADDCEEKLKVDTKDGQVQTDETNDLRNEISFCSKDLSKSTLSQTDGRVFRIENIFQDPNSTSKNARTDVDRAEEVRVRNSITFRNSLGTSYVSQPKEAEVASTQANRAEGFIRDGLITKAFITKKRSFNFRRGPSSIIYENPWRNWMIPGPPNVIQSIDYTKGSSSSWQNNMVPVISAPSLSQTNSNLINDKETSEMKFTVVEMNNNVEHDHSFSDDSLDYNENNVSSECTILKKKLIKEQEQLEHLCPPDVVAHTKKDISKLIDLENAETVCEFEDSQVELPKKKPSESEDMSLIHDYKSLILGVPTFSLKQTAEEVDDPSDRVINPGKKKVSFCSVLERRDQVNSKQTSKSTLKPIIKKRRRKSSEEALNLVQSSNDETDDSQQEDKASWFSENDCSEETLKISRDSMNSRRDSKQSIRGAVKFSGEMNSCSESDSYEYAEKDKEDVTFDRAARNLLEEYLSEAVIFMRNLNSINEYVSTANMLERYDTCSQPGRSGKRGSRRRSSPSTWNRDYAECTGRRVSKEDTDDYLKVNDDITVSTESYERCMKGIQRLEDCIRRVDRHNEFLREKYGVDCKSAGARLSLASPSTDTRTSATSNETNLDETVSFVKSSSVNDGLPNIRVVDTMKEEDIEKKIFDQLMNVANSTSCRTSTKLRNHFSKLSDLRSKSPSTCLKFSEEFSREKEPLLKNVRGILNVDQNSDDDSSDYTSYEISGNLSVSKTRPTETNDGLDHSKEGNSKYTSPWPKERIVKFDDSLSFLKRNSDSQPLHIGDLERLSSKNTSVQRVLADRFQDEEDHFKKDGSRVCACLKDHTDVDHSIDTVSATSMNDIVTFRDKLKYPGSPRARFLELLKERRRIVESSRSTSVF